MGSRGRVASIDGTLVGPEGAVVSVYDRGFLYGDAVFEVLRTYRGRPFALDEHLARLRSSARRVAIDLPWGDGKLAGEIAAAIEAAGSDEAYVRVMVTRGSGPLSLDPDSARSPRRVVLVEPLAPPPREAYLDGIAVATMQVHRAVDGTPAVGAKVTHYLANLLALREARARGAREALVLDGLGRVVEGATSNVFAVIAERLVTPPEDAGILVGITRARVMLAARRAGRVVEERVLPLAELATAAEMFITSSIRELMPVVRVDGRAVGDGKVGPVVRALHRALREDAGVGDLPMPWE